MGFKMCQMSFAKVKQTVLISLIAALSLLGCCVCLSLKAGSAIYNNVQHSELLSEFFGKRQTLHC
jgi:hypothetical protein